MSGLASPPATSIPGDEPSSPAGHTPSGSYAIFALVLLCLGVAANMADRMLVGIIREPV
jgi:hypothetical protein